MSHKESKKLRKMYKKAIEQMATKRVADHIKNKEEQAENKINDSKIVSRRWQITTMILSWLLIIQLAVIIFLLCK